MTSEPNSEGLPRVTPDDLLGMVTEEALDPSHQGWWEEFAAENPELARELLERANLIPDQDAEAKKNIIDMAVYAVTALKRASQRVVNRYSPRPEDT